MRADGTHGSKGMGEEERAVAAYRAAAQALAASVLQHCEPVRRVTILPSGQPRALCLTSSINDGYRCRNRVRAELVVLLAGRVAGGDDLRPGERDGAAAPEIAEATRLARRMIGEWGMDDEIGPMLLADGPEEGARPVRLSEDVRTLVDERVQDGDRRKRRDGLASPAKTTVRRSSGWRTRFLQRKRSTVTRSARSSRMLPPRQAPRGRVPSPASGLCAEAGRGDAPAQPPKCLLRAARSRRAPPQGTSTPP